MPEQHWVLNFAWGRAPYALDLPEITIGRGDGCPLQIEEPSAADEHARFIVEEDGRVYLDTLAPDSPTLVNGRAISGRTKLADGDFIQIGQSVLTLRDAQAVRPSATTHSSAPTLAATELPEQVRRALAARESNAKNFVVGEQRPTALATVMMESPVLPSADRATQVMSAVEDVHTTVEQPIIAPVDPEPMRPRERIEHMQTLMGVGLPARDLGSAKTMMAEAPTSRELPVTQRSAVTSATDLPAAATMISFAPTVPLEEHVRIEETQRRRGSTQTDITPLPAPLPPPTSSIANLAPFVQAATQLAQSPLQQSPLQAAPKSEFADGVDVTRADKKMTQRSDGRSTSSPVATTSSSSESTAPITARESTLPRDHSTSPDMAARPRFDSSASYVAPSKGPFGSFSRAIDFFQQMMSLAKSERTLVKPILWDLAIATPASIVVSLLLLFVHSQGGQYLVLAIGTTLLYFIDYMCNALTASLIYDYVSTGRADLPAARARAKKAMGGVLIFAAVSALLDVASTYARERRDLVSKILLNILRAIWTTATYVIMPALVIEGVSFKEAFDRSKKLMAQDPTGVGAGVVALSLCSYICGAVIFVIAFFLMRVASHIHPIVGVVLFFVMVNLYWSVTGWLKISYSTCFYLWAKRCEAEGRSETALAPLPLRHAIDAG